MLNYEELEEVIEKLTEKITLVNCSDERVEVLSGNKAIKITKSNFKTC